MNELIRTSLKQASRNSHSHSVPSTNQVSKVKMEQQAPSMQSVFEPFLFTFSPKQQLKVEKEQDVVPAMLQLEYMATADGKLKTICATQCLHRLQEDDLSQLEQQCLAQCSQKLGVHFSAFYAQQAVLQKQISARRERGAVTIATNQLQPQSQ